MLLVFKYDFQHMGATVNLNEVQSGSPIFDYLFGQLGQCIANNTVNVGFQMAQYLVC